MTEKKTKTPKCELCGLGAKFYMLIEFQSINLDELDNKILIRICDGCYDKENHRLFKPAFLKRKWEHEKTRTRVFKELVMLGMPHYNAYKISIRRMKE